MLKDKLLTTFLFCLIICTVGCGPEIAVLKEYSKEQEAIKQEVELGVKKFDLLVNDIKEEKLTAGISKKRFLRLYGKPVFETQESLLYRHPLKSFNTPKVYVYFDEEGRLISWEHIE